MSVLRSSSLIVILTFATCPKVRHSLFYRNFITLVIFVNHIFCFTDHKFRFAKLKISQILVQDYFGGPAQPTLAEYFAAKPEDFKPVPKKPAEEPARETEAELLPGASASNFKWARPIE